MNKFLHSLKIFDEDHKIWKLNASIEEYNSGKEKEKWRGSGKEQVGAG